MTARARNGRFTAERTTETTTTQRVTDRVSYAGTDTLTAVQAYDPAADWALGEADWAEGAIEGEIHHAPGWDPGPIHPAALWNAQRRAQAQQALEHLLMAAESVPPGEAVPEAVVREAVTILRAGPGASRMELTTGRSV